MKNKINKIAGISVLGCLVLLMQNSYARVGTMITPGIRLNREKSYSLSKAHEEELVRSLRRITGLQELRFAEDGALSFGDEAFAQPGSSLARQILWCARGSGNVFIIEDHFADGRTRRMAVSGWNVGVRLQAEKRKREISEIRVFSSRRPQASIWLTTFP